MGSSALGVRTNEVHSPIFGGMRGGGARVLKIKCCSRMNRVTKLLQVANHNSQCLLQ